MGTPTFQLSIVRGKTLEQPFLYAETGLQYKAITAQVSAAPLRLTVPEHGLPDNWPVRIQGVTTPTEFNTTDGTLTAWVVDPDTVELNTLDASLWAVFVPSGHLVFQTPGNLVGWNVRMHIRDRIGGVVLLSLSSDLADGADGIIEVDASAACITLHLTAAQTSAITWKGGVYDVEAILPDGRVIGLIAPSAVTVKQEITVWA